MPPKLKPVIYGLSVFVVFAILTYILKFAFGRLPEEADFLGVYTKNDLLVGLVVALAVTISHERKKRLK